MVYINYSLEQIIWLFPIEVSEQIYNVLELNFKTELLSIISALVMKYAKYNLS